VGILYAGYCTPFLLAFEDHLKQKKPTAWSQVQAVDFVVDILFVIDIFVQFCTTYEDNKGNTVDTHAKIAWHYIKSWFCLDVVSCLPGLIFRDSAEGGGPLLENVKLSRVGKLGRLFKVLKILKMLKLVRLLRMFHRFDKLLENVLKRDKYMATSSRGWVLFRFLAGAMIFAHIAGCMWWVTGEFSEGLDNPEICCGADADVLCVGIVVQENDCVSWITSGNYYDSSLLHRYITALYWSVTTLTTVGYGDISGGTTLEKIYSILMMICGVLGYSTVLGTVSSELLSKDQRVETMSHQLVTLAHFAKTVNLRYEDYRRIRRHIEVKYEDQAAYIAGGGGNLAGLLAELPVGMRTLLLSRMHKGKHARLDFFRLFNDKDFIACVIPCLATENFDKWCVCYLTGDFAERVYFIVDGQVGYTDAAIPGLNGDDADATAGGHWAALVKRLLTKEPFKVMVGGHTFGDIEVVLNLPRQFSTLTYSRTEVLMLHKRDLVRILADFPKLGDRLAKRTKDNFAEAKRNLSKEKALAGGTGPEGVAQPVSQPVSPPPPEARRIQFACEDEVIPPIAAASQETQDGTAEHAPSRPGDLNCAAPRASLSPHRLLSAHRGDVAPGDEDAPEKEGNPAEVQEMRAQMSDLQTRMQKMEELTERRHEVEDRRYINVEAALKQMQATMRRVDLRVQALM